MFGNFNQNFGLNFPVDTQGGMFGAIAPVPGVPGSDNPPVGGLTAAPLNAAPAQPPGGGPAAAAAKPPDTPSPFSSPLAPGQINAPPAKPASPQGEPPPAAAIESPFGKVSL